MRYELLSISSGSAFTEYTTTGSGNPRLFEGGDGGLYIYALRDTLLVSHDGAATFSNVIPTGVNVVNAMCQQALPQNTLVFYTTASAGTAIRRVRYQASGNETTGGWSTSTTLVSGFASVDSVGDDVLGRGAALVGNSHVGSESRVLRSAASPYTSWSDSDSGIPQSGVASRITDLERGE